MTALAIVLAGLAGGGGGTGSETSLPQVLLQAAAALGWQWLLFALAELFLWRVMGRD